MWNLLKWLMAERYRDTYASLFRVYIYIYLDLRKDTNNCPFARFLPLDFLWRSWKWSCFDYCGQFWISYLLRWSYSTLRQNVCGNSREKGRNTRADSSWLKHENMKWSGFFLDMVIFILKCTNQQKMDRNQTKICPGKKFVTNEYPGMYIYIIDILIW